MNFDFEDENPMSPPKLRVEPGQWVVRETCDLSLSGHTGEVSRVSGRRGSSCPLLAACPQGNASGPDICLQEGVSFLGKARVPISASDFYPRFVIKNMFKDLIICIFPSELTR